jgi:hypothetical protein
MPDSDDTARERAERAARLREKISGIVQEPGAKTLGDGKPKEPESPRDFVERRMREIGDKDDG